MTASQELKEESDIGEIPKSGRPSRESPDEAALFSTEDDEALEASGVGKSRKARVSLRNLIPNYTIERKISSSSSPSQAVIYKGFQRSLERAVAIKTLLARGDERERLARRFLREVSQVARLPHPNIVVIHDAGRVKNFYYFVMEYLAGGSIGDLVVDSGPLPIRRALAIGYDLAKALSYIHTHGLVHRGVSPGAILLDTATNLAKLTGFGFAREADLAPGDTTYFNMPAVGFTYLSPEQVLGTETDARSDVYSLGATLWFLIAGRHPFKGRTQIEISSAIADGDLMPLIKAAPECPKSVAKIVRTCMATEAEARYDSAAALARALERLLIKLGERAAPSSRLASYVD